MENKIQATSTKVSAAAYQAALLAIPATQSQDDEKGFNGRKAWADELGAIASYALQLRQLFDSGSVPVFGKDSKEYRNLVRITGELRRQHGRALKTLRDKDELELE